MSFYHKNLFSLFGKNRIWVTSAEMILYINVQFRKKKNSNSFKSKLLQTNEISSKINKDIFSYKREYL